MMKQIIMMYEKLNRQQPHSHVKELAGMTV